MTLTSASLQAHRNAPCYVCLFVFFTTSKQTDQPYTRLQTDNQISGFIFSQ